jgi:hypothetical protein
MPEEEVMSVLRCEECERRVDTDFEEVEWIGNGCICQRCWDDEGPPEFNDE